jgi:hypothetical protein
LLRKAGEAPLREASPFVRKIGLPVLRERLVRRWSRGSQVPQVMTERMWISRESLPHRTLRSDRSRAPR